MEEIKYLETMKVFDESPKTKAEPTEHVESARDMATMKMWLLFTISEDAA